MSTPTNPRCYHCNAPAPEGITMAYGSHVELSCRVCALLKPEAFYATRVWPSPNGDAQCVVCNDTIHALASRRIEKNEATGVWENICLPCWAAKLPQLPAGTCTYCGNWTTESFMSTSGIRVWSHDACCKNVGSPRTGAWPSSEDRDAQAAEAVGNQLV